MAFVARLGTTDDIDEVVRLRAAFFESLGETGDGWQRTCADVLAESMAAGSMIVAVVDAPNGAGLAAVGTAEIQQRLPGPTKPTGLLGYIGTMATDPAFRRQGLARLVLDRLLRELGDRDVQRIELHATPPAEHLYRSVGFTERPGGLEMRYLPA